MTKIINIDESTTISEAEWLEFVELMYGFYNEGANDHLPDKKQENDTTDVFDYMHVFMGDQ